MKVMAGVVIAILLLAIFALFWPEADDYTTAAKNDITNTKISKNENSTAVVLQKDNIAAEDKTAEMQITYEELELERKKLKRQLARTKHLLWGITFPPEQAKEINKIMLNAHQFEKTPRMLGAFHDVDEIKVEIEKVKYAIQSLQELKSLVNKSQ